MTLTLIQGGDEPVLKPALVQDDQGRLCMQCTLGPYSATLALPEALAGKGEDQLQDFFAEVVPEMTKKLYAMRQADNHKANRKVKRK